MKKILCIFLTIALIISFCACGQSKEIAQDTSPITMYIPMGNTGAYYTALAEKIKTELGIDVEFVYQISGDTTNMTRLYFANNDLPADIVFTASKTDDELLKTSCMDLLSRTSITAKYTPTTVKGCTTEDGAVYQLPVSSRLIGITYNETLLNEMGWAVPQSFADMVDLKAKCDAAGIKFAVCDSMATGHGFNWLFHLMGSQWLSTPEGTKWFEDYQNGKTSIDEFKEHCEYFKEWTEAGLWGDVNLKEWTGNNVFGSSRALFWYGLVNVASGYSGPMLDDNGNETGVMLNDTFKTIPWISEDGSNNCYTFYDNCWISISKEMEAPDKADKLNKIIQILNFLTEDDATVLVSEMAQDTYVSVSDYVIKDDRLYSKYYESINNGFVQPWYYNEFDSDSIVFTGEKVNDYIAGKGNFEDIFTTLDKYNQQKLNAQIEVLATFPEGLGYEDTAKLVALSCAEALNDSLKKNGIAGEAEVALVPYTAAANQLQPWSNATVSNSKVYPGAFDAAASLALIPTSTGNVVGIYMSGAEIKALVEKKYDPSDRFIDKTTGKSTYDSAKYGPYPYACLTKGGAALEDNKEYLVALCDKYLSLADLTAFEAKGKVLTLSGTLSLNDGVKMYCSEHQTITPKDLVLK